MPVIQYSETYYTGGGLSYTHQTQTITEKTLFNSHSHSAYEMYIFLAGQGKLSVEGVLYPLQPGSIFLFRPMEFHKLYLEGGCHYERQIFHFSPEYLEGLCASPEQDENTRLLHPYLDRELGRRNMIPAASVKNSEIPAILEGMDEIVRERDPLTDITVKIKFVSLLIGVNQLYDPVRTEVQVNSEDFPPVVREIVQFINDNLSSDLSLSLISQKFYFSKYYLNRIFTKAIGDSICEYIIKKRLLTAKQLMHNGATATEACHQSGFGDYSNFYKSYIKFFGISPREEKVRA